MNMLLSFALVNISLLIAAAPAPAGSYTSLDPREDGTANVEAYIKAAIADQARHALTERDPPESTVEDNIADIQRSVRHLHDPVDGLKAPKAQKRADGNPPLPPIRVPLVAHSAAFFAEGEYVGVSNVASDPDLQFSTRFDTLEEDYIVPSYRCRPEDGCAGAASDKYQELGRRDFQYYHQGPIKQHYTIGATDLTIVSIGRTVGYPQVDGTALTVMGLGAKTRSQDDWFTKMVSEKGLANRPPEFSFFFGRAITGSVQQSQLLIVGRDPGLYMSDPVKIPVYVGNRSPYQRHWVVPLSNFAVGHRIIPDDGLPRVAAIDTASPLITLKNSDADEIYSFIPGAIPIYHTSQLLYTTIAIVLTPKPTAIKSWAYPCSEQPVVEFLLGPAPGTRFALDAWDINLGRLHADGDGFLELPSSPAFRDALARPDPLCLAAIVSTNPAWYEELRSYVRIPHTAFLGLPFLRSWYADFSRDPTGNYVALAQNRLGGLPGADVDDYRYLGADVPPAVDIVFVDPDAPGEGDLQPPPQDPMDSDLEQPGPSSAQADEGGVDQG